MLSWIVVFIGIFAGRAHNVGLNWIYHCCTLLFLWLEISWLPTTGSYFGNLVTTTIFLWFAFATEGRDQRIYRVDSNSNRIHTAQAVWIRLEHLILTWWALAGETDTITNLVLLNLLGTAFVTISLWSCIFSLTTITDNPKGGKGTGTQERRRKLADFFMFTKFLMNEHRVRYSLF